MAIRLSAERSALEDAVRTIQREGENAAVGIGTILEERERVAGLVARGVASPKELDRLDEDRAERQAQAEDAIRSAQAKALDAIDTAARDVAHERTAHGLSDHVSRRWHDAVLPALERGLGLSELLDLFAADSLALAALELNWPSYVGATSGKVNDPDARRMVEGGLHAIEQRLLPHLTHDDQEFRRNARSIEGLAVTLDESVRFGLKQAAGTSDAGDRMRLGYAINDGERIAAGEFVE